MYNLYLALCITATIGVLQFPPFTDSQNHPVSSANHLRLCPQPLSKFSSAYLFAEVSTINFQSNMFFTQSSSSFVTTWPYCHNLFLCTTFTHCLLSLTTASIQCKIVYPSHHSRSWFQRRPLATTGKVSEVRDQHSDFSYRTLTHFSLLWYRINRGFFKGYKATQTPSLYRMA